MWSTGVALRNGMVSLLMLSEMLGCTRWTAISRMRSARIRPKLWRLPRGSLYPHLRVIHPGRKPFIRQCLLIQWWMAEEMMRRDQLQRLEAFAKAHPRIRGHREFAFLKAHLLRE